MRPKGVITGATVHGVVRFPAFHVVVIFRRVEVKGFFDDVFASQLVVFKLEVIAVAVPLEEIILEPYLIVAAAVSPDDEIVAFAAKGGITGLRTLKVQGVGLFVVVTVVFDCIFAMTSAEDVSVAFKVAAFQVVITGAAIKRVMTGTAKEGVIARIAVERVVAVIATERVVAFPTMQGIIAVAAAQAVVTGITVNGVVAVMRPKGVITLAAMQVVGTVVALNVIVVIRTEAVSQGGECFFAKGIAVSLKGTVIARFLRVLHEFLGKRCHVGVFAVGVAFGEQFAEVSEGFAGIFRVNFVEEGSNTAVVQLQFAVLAHAKADGVEVGFEAGLEEQAVVEVVGKIGVGFFDGVNDMLRL